MTRISVSKQKMDASIDSSDVGAEINGGDDECGDLEAKFLRGSRRDVEPRGSWSAKIALSGSQSACARSLTFRQHSDRSALFHPALFVYQMTGICKQAIVTVQITFLHLRTTQSPSSWHVYLSLRAVLRLKKAAHARLYKHLM